MDYYYALLQSYDLLKRRKFKLSLREEENEAQGIDLQDPQVIQALTKIVTDLGSKGDMESTDNVQNGVQVYKVEGEDDQFNGRYSANVGTSRGYSSVLLKGGTLDPNNKENAKKMLAKLYGGGEEGEEGSIEDLLVPGNAINPNIIDGRTYWQERIERAKLEALSLVDELEATDETFSSVATETLKNLLGNLLPSDLPVDDEQRAKEVENKDRQTDVALGGLVGLLMLTKEIQNNPEDAQKGKYTTKINQLFKDNRISIDENGVRFGDMYFETSLSDAEHAPVAAAILRLDKLQLEDMKKEGLASAAKPAKKKKATSYGTKESFRGTAAEFLTEATQAFRDYLNCSPKDAGCRDEAEKVLLEKIEQAKQDGTLSEADLVDMFLVGLGIERGDILADNGSIKDGFAVKFIRDRLVEAGVSRERAEELIQEGAGNANAALLLVMIANRQWEEDYLGDLRAQTRATGKEGMIEGQKEQMTDQGAKADMVDKFCEKPGGGRYKREEIKNHFESLFTPETLARYADVCADDIDRNEDDDNDDDSGVGLDSLIREIEDPDDPTQKCIEVDRELKVFEKTGTAKHKLGQLGDSNVERACKDSATFGPKDKEAWTEPSKKYRETVKKRLAACGFGAAWENMCATDVRIRERVKKITKVLNRKSPNFSPKQATEAIAELQRWNKQQQMRTRVYEKDAKGKDKIDPNTGDKVKRPSHEPQTQGEERYEAAKLAIHPPTGGNYPAWIQKQATLEDRKPEAICQTHLTRVSRDLTSLAVLEEMRKGKNSRPVTRKDSKGKTVKHGRVLKGEGLDYALSRYMLTSGSDRECVKQKRTFQEGTQGVMLNNAEIQANVKAIKDGRGRIRTDGKQYYVEVKTKGKDGKPVWEERAIGSTENGGITWKSSHDASDALENTSEGEGWDQGRETGADRERAEEVKLELGTDLHSKWQEEFRKNNPEAKSRVKKTKDKAWAEEHGTDEVDILNTDFGDLPDDWQGENLAAATTAVDAVRNSDSEEEAASLVHDAWMERNSWQKDDNPDLFVPYDELSDEEKEKDLAQVRDALERLKNPKEEPQEESLLMNFLQGQQRLLEKLINQTT